MIEEGDLLPERHCFSNSLSLAMSLLQEDASLRGKIFYVEGLAIDQTGAYAHAWLTFGDQAIDYTWPTGWMTTYFGIPFDPEWVHKVTDEVGYVGFLGEWDLFSQHVERKLLTCMKP